MTHMTEKPEPDEPSVPTLRTALRNLTNESEAVLGLAEPVLREVIGHTNLAAFELRVEEANALLAQSSSAD